ncbi:HD-GYP domain-containing protein (c-di-GMP phosphodiesterase class II) [Anaerosolibacter carboniphilus]|uniref:HD-GYP domain-containing protein (C-di-GMP phosphodiesterase class II) n=1 Tax=Anaerosolibacter carboniphilus TaxID=1417629 RepID=A0A841L9W3_9FIRM|nr:HD domain-containing phosphohydrolase [Anaerosolibacter carboniphilus]MBB6219025.1 HD-GYP domain-containing protein (c-di-GMP phosphodiesterase class II) [Anaerosolibacter carboniphilus]
MQNSRDIVYVKRQIKELIPGDIVLHPVYRTDGLMLINQYKTLSADIIQKIVYHLPAEMPVIVAATQELYEQFIENRQYGNKQYINLLKEAVMEYNKLMTMPLNIVSFLDSRADFQALNQSSAVEENYKTENDYQIATPEKNHKMEDDYLSSLYKFPLFWTFENNLESLRLKNRAVEVRKKLLDIIKSNDILRNSLNQIKNYKDILLIHSINATSISLMIGLTLELTEEELIDLGITTLLMDASLTKLPKNTFNTHLQFSTKQKELYQIYVGFIKAMSNDLPMLRKESIIYGVLDYYEFYNGEGYPKGKKGEDISLFGRIISIAHFYEEKVGGYFHSSGTKPREAIKLVWENRSKKLDPNIVDIFVRRSNFFKIGESMIIPEYGRGIIVGFEDYINSPHMPIVKFEGGMTINLLRKYKNK